MYKGHVKANILGSTLTVLDNALFWNCHPHSVYFWELQFAKALWKFGLDAQKLFAIDIYFDTPKYNPRPITWTKLVKFKKII